MPPAEPRRRRGDVVDARVVKALAHPTRVRILRVLRDRELASPVELSAELGVALGTVGYHVRRLETLGFIELAKRTQRRGAVEHHYRARDALDLPGEPGAPATRDGRTAAAGGLAAQALAAVDEARAALARGGFDAISALAERRIAVLDERGRTRLREEMGDWQLATQRIVCASAKRIASAGAAAVTGTCTAIAMAFEGPDPDDDVELVS
jgi:DNA-binding transcriptional ArsR family regulator